MSQNRHAQTALVCGASGGLGQVLARTLQDAGMTVRGTMRNPGRDPGRDAGKSTDPGIHMLPMDVLDDASVEACLAMAAREMGSLDVVINCVNEMMLGSVEETSAQELERVYAVNVQGYAAIARAAVPLMRQQGNGLLVSMSSLGGILAVPILGAYTSSKFALEALSEALYQELKGENIDVVIMQPVAMHMDRPDVGDHLKIAQAAGEESLTHAVARLMAKDTRESKLTPEIVSAEILKVIRSKKRKLRYPLDRAKVVSKIKRIAPQSMIDKLVGGLMEDATRA